LTDDIILETRALTKEFKGFIAVKDVSLKVRRGSIHALIGPNGAGKTTCFNLLTHFLEPTRGQIFFKGREITGSPPARIARMGLVRSFQISAVFPHLTVLENVRVALQRKRGASFDFWRSEQVLRNLDGSCWISPAWSCSQRRETTTRSSPWPPPTTATYPDIRRKRCTRTGRTRSSGGCAAGISAASSAGKTLFETRSSMRWRA
jgi:ABC-type dipeptide/oligopeptide/nickel transport system ATPase subunit